MTESQNKSGGPDTTVWVIVIAVIGFVAWAGPRYIQAHATHASNSCVNNLRQFDGAKNEWALENNKTNGTVCTAEDIKPYVKLNSQGNLPRCPDGGRYFFGRVGQPVRCSLGTNIAPPHVLPE